MLQRPLQLVHNQAGGQFGEEEGGLGLIQTLHPTDLTPARLAEELLSLLLREDIPNRANLPPMDGAQRVAQLLLE